MRGAPAPARRWDAGRLAAILAGFARETPWMPEQDKAACRRDLVRLMREGEVMTLRGRSGPLGFIALRGQEIHALYVAPDARGQGVGKRLLDHAKSRADRLTLWTCQANEGARRFYGREGFELDRFGTGAGNEQGVPDMRLIWRRESAR